MAYYSDFADSSTLSDRFHFLSVVLLGQFILNLWHLQHLQNNTGLLSQLHTMASQGCQVAQPPWDKAWPILDYICKSLAKLLPFKSKK